MKFHALGQKHGQSIKDQIVKKFRENGFISLGDAKEFAGDFAHKDDQYIGWDDDSDLDRKIRVRETKKGWFVYLPEPNAVIKIGEETTPKLPNIDVTVFETDSFERLIKTLDEGFYCLMQALAFNGGRLYRPCIVKAKKSGRKEERQDRKAKFHRWADLSKGVQQVVAIVEFEDGHVEQVQPDRIIFQEVKENE